MAKFRLWATAHIDTYGKCHGVFTFYEENNIYVVDINTSYGTVITTIIIYFFTVFV